MNKNKIVLVGFFAFMIAVTFTACKNKRSAGWEYARNMYDPIAYNPDQPNKNFTNGQTAQTPPANTNALGFEKYKFPNTKEGYIAAGLQLTNPISATPEHLLEGKKLFITFCSPCHGEQGDGQGHLVKIGKYVGVPSYYGVAVSSRDGMLMKDLPAGRIYHTIVYGLNAMGSHASQVEPTERWKIVMYVQQLQKTQ